MKYLKKSSCFCSKICKYTSLKLKIIWETQKRVVVPFYLQSRVVNTKEIRAESYWTKRFNYLPKIDPDIVLIFLIGNQIWFNQNKVNHISWQAFRCSLLYIDKKPRDRVAIFHKLYLLAEKCFTNLFPVTFLFVNFELTIESNYILCPRLFLIT